MWHLAGGLDWDTLAELSGEWANSYELTLAKDFVAHLDATSAGETGRLFFDAEGTDAATEVRAAEISTALRHNVVLGLLAEVGIPSRPEGPAVAVKVRITGNEAQVVVHGSNATARSWVPFGKFTVALDQEQGKLEIGRFADDIAEGTLNRLVRVQLRKGAKEKGKTQYALRIDNASPLVLNGLAALGTTSKPEDTPRVLSGICLSPRKSMTVPASEEVVNALGLKKGVKLVALDLSGL
jgi:hypothetical protein